MTSHPGAGAPKEKRRPINRPARVFISYAQEDAELRAELEKHLTGLRQSGHVHVWHDRMILPGDDRDGVVDAELEAADIVLLLVSASFFASSSCFDIELAKALERHQRGQTHVIPVLVRDCDWTAAPFSHLDAVPRKPGAGAMPVTSWSDRDAAWASVARELRALLESGPAAPRDPRPMPEANPNAPANSRSYAVPGILLAGIVAAGIAIGVRGKKEDPRAPSPVETAPPSSALPLPSPTVSAPASAVATPPPTQPPGRTGKQTPTAPAPAAPTASAAASVTANAGPKRGTATLSGAFWSLGVPRSELGGAAFVCLDPASRPSELAGVQPTCSVLSGSGSAQCSRSDRAREVPLGMSVSWRLPCP
jgi:hypothetical protein